MSKQSLDMQHGRQGGRIVPFHGHAEVDLARCPCGKVLLKADIEAGQCETCNEPWPSLF